MKKVLFALFTLMFSTMAFAQDATIMGILGLLKPLIDAYAGTFGWMVQVVAIVGSLRLAIKPVMSLIDIYVRATPSLEDDELVAKIEANKMYKLVVYILDWVASIKVVKPAAKK